jgi:integrase/transposase-like protein
MAASIRKSCSTIRIDQSARSTQSRPGGGFFARPTDPTQRRYEALRAYLFEGRPAAEVARAFGYSIQTLHSLVRDFRAGRREFFVEARPGPKRSPAKERARARIVALRRAGHSIDEIARALAAEGRPLNRTGIAEVVAEEGFARLWRRPEAARGAPRREALPRAEVVDWEAFPARVEAEHAGLLLCVPDLVELDLPAIVAAAGYPATKVIPAISSVLSLLALKLASVRRVSHVEDLAADPGAALLAGLSALPKATALASYSYRLSHERQRRLLAALDAAMVRSGLVEGRDFDLDFHAVMHWGEDAALERNYVPRRSQRTRSVLTFFAQDAGTHNLVYANADLARATQAREVIAFCDHWHELSGQDPQLLVFDQRLTTQAVLSELDQRGVRFITLRMRTRALLRHIEAIDPRAWKTIQLDRDGHRRPQVVDETARLSGYPREIRQLVVRGLGRDAPTVIITNDHDQTARQLLERYARRMTIEQRLAEAIRSFHLDALSSAVPLNIDLDVVLSVLAGATCAALRRRLSGYATATPDTLQRRFLESWLPERERIAGAAPGAGSLLVSPRTGRRLTRQAIYGLIGRLARAAEVGELNPHGLRATMVTLALDSGMPLRDVQDSARHADPRTTRRYDRDRHSLNRHAALRLAELGDG